MQAHACLADEIEQLGAIDPARAHEAARKSVASNPSDEMAALQLAETVRRFPLPKTRAPNPFDLAPTDVRRAEHLLKQGLAEEAELILRSYLSQVRNDPFAMQLMAQIAARSGFAGDALKILRRAVELHPDRAHLWVALARIIHRTASQSERVEMVDDALAALDSALRVAPGYEPALSFKGSVLLQFRRVEEAEGTFEDFLRAHPENATAWKNYGFVLKTVGKFGEAVAAYRTSVAMDPKESGAWWGIANLKLARFFQHDIGEMERILEGSLDQVMQIEVHFALAKAHEVMGNYERAAHHLQEGNRLRLDANPHDIDEVQRNVGKAIETYTRSFFTRREGQGCKSYAPIFVIGMPRSGSTLIEQILSSHSLIEGTQELFAIHKLEGELVGESTPTIEDAVAKADPAKLRALGERYLFLTRHVRLTDRPHYIDKNPANWRHTGFIHTILPNAKIIDVRRNPMDCCFANYGQHFNWGANFTYGQAEIARQYGEYVRLMRHFEHEIPGIVHKVIYDDLVDDFEPAVRLLFDYLELPFEEACLRFFDTKRAVHTPSSEQVRQPINKAGFGRWRNYEPWLGELKSNLGEVLENWR